MPKTLRPWPRLGVSLSVKTVSSSFRWPRMSCPTGAASSSTSRPPWSSDSFSSRAEHSMPWLSTPRSLPSLIANGLPSSPGGSAAPTRAHGTLMPGRTFGAPQTMFSVAPEPSSTWQTLRRSAFGCRSTESTFATTTPANGGATGRASSTSMPDMVSRSASSAVPIGGSQNSRNQDSGNCISRCLDRDQANCARKRRSFSKYRRRSLTP